MLLLSEVVVAAGVVALGRSVAVTLGVKAPARLVAEQVNVGLLVLQVKPTPVRLLSLVNEYPPVTPTVPMRPPVAVYIGATQDALPAQVPVP
jgi:hypothetical protein